MYGDRRQVIEAIGIADEALAYLGASEPYANELVGKAAYKNRHEWILAVKDKAMRREEQLRS